MNYKVEFHYKSGQAMPTVYRFNTLEEANELAGRVSRIPVSMISKVIVTGPNWSNTVWSNK